MSVTNWWVVCDIQILPSHSHCQTDWSRGWCAKTFLIILNSGEDSFDLSMLLPLFLVGDSFISLVWLGYHSYSFTNLTQCSELWLNSQHFFHFLCKSVPWNKILGGLLEYKCVYAVIAKRAKQNWDRKWKNHSSTSRAEFWFPDHSSTMRAKQIPSTTVTTETAEKNSVNCVNPVFS